MTDFECAEPTHLDIPLLLKRFFDCVKKRINDTRAVFFGNHGPSRLGNLSRNVFDQVGFSHWSVEWERRSRGVAGSSNIGR